MIDLLESRLHLSLSFALDAGTLTLGGTPAADVILICKVPPTASDPESLSVKINSSTFYLPLSEVERITIKTGNGNDKVSFGEAVNIPVTIFGGLGNDKLSGGARSNKLVGEAGNDVLIGSSGRDQLSGGPGTDTADYSSRLDDLVITLDGKPNDGTPTVGTVKGEGDNVMSDIEIVAGGAGDDSITGSAKRDILKGNDGNDTLVGGDGDDLLVGGKGADVLRGGLGDDTIHAIDLDSTDTVDGGDGFDSVTYDSVATVKDNVLGCEDELYVLET